MLKSSACKLVAKSQVGSRLAVASMAKINRADVVFVMA